MWMKTASNFRKIAQVQNEGVAQLLLDFFCQFQPGIAYAYESITLKKRVSKMQLFAKAVNCLKLHLRDLFDRLSKTCF